MSSPVLFGEGNYTVAKKMLDATILRHEALASNLANVETPGYQRIDLDPSFDAQLKALSKAGNNSEIEALMPSLQKDTTAKTVGPNGNNVQLDTEMVEMNKNALNYDYLTQFISNNIKHLNAAITGEISN